MSLALGSGLLVAVIRAGGDGADGVAAVSMALAAGVVVASGWLLAAAFLDLLAGEPPSRRRVLWTAGVTLLAFASPLLVVAAQAAR